MRSTRTPWTHLLLLAGLVAAAIGPVSAGAGSPSMAALAMRPASVPASAALLPRVTLPEYYDLSPAMTDMAPVQTVPAKKGIPETGAAWRIPPKYSSEPSGSVNAAPLASPAGPASVNTMPSPLANFDGIDNQSTIFPPDTEGTVGYDPGTGKKYYFQWVNTWYAIWDVTNPALPVKVYPSSGFAVGNTPWAGFPGACATTNDGDPIVLFDKLANRWFMSQFALPNFPLGPFYTCIAVSQTADPTGSWYRYAYQWKGGTGLDVMNDYPKFGVWPDGYYMSVNQFSAGSTSWAGGGVGVFERAQMLVGGAARLISFDLYNAEPTHNFGSLLPSDLDGTTPPPANSPNYFVEWDDSSIFGDPNDTLRLWHFHTDWNTPANSTFGSSLLPDQAIATANVNMLCPTTGHCIPEPGGYYVDSLADRLMYRLAYRNYGDHEALVANHTVDTTSGSNHAGIHWFELRRSSSAWSLYQDNVYSPDNTLSRWMGSLAMDHVGNMALGYSASGVAVPNYPSVRYTGRLASDPPGTMGQGEVTLVQGLGAQQEGTYYRWGDYSTMSVDPADDCTFWYTQQYYPANSARHWYTRIGAFRFDNCAAASQGGLAGLVSNSSTGLPISGAQVIAAQNPSQSPVFSTYSGVDGGYHLMVPTGSYSMTATAFGFQPMAVNPVSVATAFTTTQNFSLTPLPLYTVSGVLRDSATNWPLYGQIQISGYPTTIWTDPVTGFYSAQLPGSSSYQFSAQAWVGGYATIVRTVAVAAANRTEDFALVADPVACNAPGYTISGWNQDFEANNGGLSTSGTTSWAWGTPTSGPNSAHSGTKAWATNLAGDYNNYEDGYLSSGDINLSAFAGQAPTLSWWQWLQSEANYDFASVEVSKDGGASWAVVYGPTSGTIDLAWARRTLQLDSSYSVSNFRARFHFTSDFLVTAPGWYLDDMAVGRCQAPAGGLVVGTVKDQNTNARLNGASVSVQGGATTITSDPGDPAVGGGFYTVFAASGSRVLDANQSNYQTASASPTVGTGTTQRVDFSLAAGRFAANPTSLSALVPLGGLVTLPLTVTNNGSASATYELVSIYGVSPLLPDPTGLPSYPSARMPYWDATETGQFEGGERRPATAPSAPAAWGTAATLPTGDRYRAASTSCSGTSYYVFGGQSGAGVVLGESWRFDADADAWTRLADMPATLMNLQAACISGYIYLVGGYDGSAHTNSFLVYNTGTDTWTSATWPNVRTPMVAAANGKLYAFGGNPGPSAETWQYDPATATWTGPLAAMPAAAAYGTTVTAEGGIYIVGGADGAGAMSNVQRYDPLANTWAVGPVLPNARMNPIAAWYGPALYVAAGGGNGGNFIAYTDALTLDLTAWPGGSWTVNSAVPTPVVAAAQACINDRIYALDGVNGSDYPNVHQYLDDGVTCHQSGGGWITTSPVTGTLASGTGQLVAVTLHADVPGASVPGLYTAHLQVTGNTPYATVSVPIRMLVGSHWAYLPMIKR